ncbi:hypothetical protein [Tenacibaculum sp. 190524A05c]|uniref:hypothetical protein n=1 Tax=Tenacibaculum platacis TaxID=3137852 RepID=UPI0031FB9FE1
MNSYKGIVFEKGYNRPFSDFKKEFGNTLFFKRIDPNDREAELKKAYKAATNGNNLRASGKSKKAASSEDKK